MLLVEFGLLRLVVRYLVVHRREDVMSHFDSWHRVEEPLVFDSVTLRFVRTFPREGVLRRESKGFAEVFMPGADVMGRLGPLLPCVVFQRPLDLVVGSVDGHEGCGLVAAV